MPKNSGEIMRAIYSIPLPCNSFLGRSEAEARVDGDSGGGSGDEIGVGWQSSSFAGQSVCPRMNGDVSERPTALLLLIWTGHHARLDLRAYCSITLSNPAVCHLDRTYASCVTSKREKASPKTRFRAAHISTSRATRLSPPKCATRRSCS